MYRYLDFPHDATAAAAKMGSEPNLCSIQFVNTHIASNATY